MRSTTSRPKTFQYELLAEELESSALIKPPSYTSLVDLEMAQEERDGTSLEDSVQAGPEQDPLLSRCMFPISRYIALIV